jgi:glycosyltransferase involved in cell wall biosynthesis
MGKPVIVSDSGNLKTIVKENINGYRIASNSPEELSEKILKLYNNKKLRMKISKENSDECRKKYSWRKIAEKVLK